MPSPRLSPSFRESASDDFAEASRAVRECLRGSPPVPRLLWRMGLFDTWAARVFANVIRPHLLTARAAADSGDVEALLRADGELSAPESSALAGRAWLESMNGVRVPGCFRRFAAAAAEGSTPAHFHTVLAARSAVFSLGVLPMLQAALYSEWRTAVPGPDDPDSPEDFFSRARASLSLLTAASLSHAPLSSIRTASR